jgi:LPXTG-motif cell wall-anchored protein
MSAPTFVPERDEIWYSDGNSGFYVVRLTGAARAIARGAAAPPAGAPAPAAPPAEAPAGPTPSGPRLPSTGPATPWAAAGLAVVGLLLLARRRRA